MLAIVAPTKFYFLFNSFSEYRLHMETNRRTDGHVEN